MDGVEATAKILALLEEQDRLREENKELKGKIFCLKRKIKVWKQRVSGQQNEWYGT